MSTLGGAWNGISVGEMYLREVDGPAAPAESDSSSMGVMGGGGVSGGEGEARGLPRKGDDSMGADVACPTLGLRERCERRDLVEAPAGLPEEITSAFMGVICPPDASKMLPASLP